MCNEKALAESILKDVSFHRERLSELFNEIKELVKDKSVPLEIRWELFKEFDDGDELWYIPDFPTILGIYELGDVIYLERYRTLDIFTFIEIVEESLIEHNNIYEEAVEYFNIPSDLEPTDDQLIYIVENKFMPEFKEWVLDNFLYKFTFDW